VTGAPKAAVQAGASKKARQMNSLQMDIFIPPPSGPDYAACCSGLAHPATFSTTHPRDTQL
jgi:hypothetical protein